MSYSKFGYITSESGAGAQGPPGVGFKLDIDGNYDMEGKKITNIGAATQPGDVATRAEITSQVGGLEDAIESQLLNKVSASELSDELDDYVDKASQETITGQKTWQAQQNFNGPIMGISAMIGTDKVSYTPAADVSMHIQKASAAATWVEGDAWPNDWGTPPVESFKGAITYLSAGHTAKTLSKTQMMSNHSVSLYSQAEQTLPDFQVCTGGVIAAQADAGILPVVLSEPAVRLSIDNANTRITNKLGVNVATGSSLTGGLTIQGTSGTGGRHDVATLKDSSGSNQWYVTLANATNALQFGKAGQGYTSVVLSPTGDIAAASATILGSTTSQRFTGPFGAYLEIAGANSARIRSATNVSFAQFSNNGSSFYSGSSSFLRLYDPDDLGNGISIDAELPSTGGAIRTYRLADVGTHADFVMTEGNQTVGGTKTYTNDITAAGISLGTVEGRVTALESAPGYSPPFTPRYLFHITKAQATIADGGDAYLRFNDDFYHTASGITIFPVDIDYFSLGAAGIYFMSVEVPFINSGFIHTIEITNGSGKIYMANTAEGAVGRESRLSVSGCFRYVSGSVMVRVYNGRSGSNSISFGHTSDENLMIKVGIHRIA